MTKKEFEELILQDALIEYAQQEFFCWTEQPVHG